MSLTALGWGLLAVGAGAGVVVAVSATRKPTAGTMKRSAPTPGAVHLRQAVGLPQGVTLQGAPMQLLHAPKVMPALKLTVALPLAAPMVLVGNGAPYRLVDAVAMAHKLITWIREPEAAACNRWIADELEAALNYWLAQRLTDAEKMRVVMFGIVLPTLANDFERAGDDAKGFADSSFTTCGFVRREPLLRRAGVAGTDLDRQQVAGMAMWIAMWLASPQAMVLVPSRRVGGSPIPVRNQDGWTYAHAADWQPANVAASRDALEFLAWRLWDFIRDWCESAPTPDMDPPTPCDQNEAFRQQLIGMRHDEENDLFDDPAAIAAGNLKRVNLCAQIPLMVAWPHEYPVMPAWVRTVTSVSLGVLKAIPAVGQALGGVVSSIASNIQQTLQLGTQAVTAALAVAQAGIHGGNIAAVVGAIINSALASDLRDKSALLLGPDLTAAAAAVKQFSAPVAPPLGLALH